MAAHHGLDPLAYLALEADDMRIVSEVLAAAEKFEVDRNTALIQAVASHTANLTAQAITGWFAKNAIQVYWKGR